MQQRMVWQKSSYLSLVEDPIAFLMEQWDLETLSIGGSDGAGTGGRVCSIKINNVLLLVSGDFFGRAVNNSMQTFRHF